MVPGVGSKSGGEEKDRGRTRKVTQEVCRALQLFHSQHACEDLVPIGPIRPPPSQCLESRVDPIPFTQKVETT